MNEKSPTLSYGLLRDLGPVDFQRAREVTEAALKAEGFGVLTEIDIKATLKQKLGEDLRPYLILGACNPKLAHQVLQHEPYVGLLLPCNVVLSEQEDGSVYVSAIDPVKMFEVVGRDEIKALALTVKQSLARALEAIML